MYFGKRIVYNRHASYVIIQDIGHTLAVRIMKYNITTTLTFFGLKTVTLGGAVGGLRPLSRRRRDNRRKIVKEKSHIRGYLSGQCD
jgi:hypothetical protein